jgi:hypothetical protein
MASPQRQARIYALREHLSAHVNMLREELNLFFDNPVGVAGHPDFFHTIEEKLVKLSEYQGALDALEHQFGQSPNGEP